MGQVIIGMDPHKRSATIEIIDGRETVLAGGRFGTDRVGYKAMLALGRRYPERIWAVEGCNGIGRHIAQRLVADGETVIDVPAKLSARARVFATGQGRKSDPVDAHSVAVAALRAKGLRTVAVDDATVALRLLVDRRDGLGQARTDLLNRIHKLLLELLPGGAKKFLSADQARAVLNTIRPRDLVGRTRRRLASELISELVQVDKKIKAANKELTELVDATGSSLQDLNGIGPSGAARLIGDVGDIHRFASRAHFASWNGTAPLDASSGDQQRHRLSRAGNRRINRVLHIMAVVQLRHDTAGRAYYRRRLAEGKTPMEAMRALKRRLSDVVYRQMIRDAKTSTETGPGGQVGATLQSSAADPNPQVNTSEQSLPGPADIHHKPRSIRAA
ncbi:IS110 family transposase [Dactylosporangium sp. NPDC049525]|uniref:IS110 family transposase n=1 Tax=Dactylosporangium sp. NPDC049525 TaxID=3154730 RepID=UPI0034353ABB